MPSSDLASKRGSHDVLLHPGSYHVHPAHTKMLYRVLLSSLVMLAISLSFSRQSYAANTVNPAVITGTSTGGVGYVTETGDATGLGAQIGEWGIPYTGGANGPPQPGAEPAGESIWRVNINVNDGGIASFNYQIQTWDGGPWDWLTIELQTPTGLVAVVPKYANPSDTWGIFYMSPVVSGSVDLSHWANQSVTLVFSVEQDGYGDETQALISGLSLKSCAIAPLSPLATDPATQMLENGGIDTADLTSGTQTALSCFRSAISRDGGNFRLNSAYRSPAYQSHLREVWDKWRLLKNNTAQECQVLKSQVKAEFDHHGLGASTLRPASPSGTHTRGIAMDIRITGLSSTTADADAHSCNLYRPFPTRDPVHYQYH